ncbi:MAG: FkbM family methyltransferase [Roseburia sp.]|nr:FkbM family methyltransferase [Roseburia sp.]
MSISKETIRNAEKLYDTLEDEESKLIFRNKLLYSITNENKYWHDILRYYNQEQIDKISEIARQSREVIVYGAGTNCVPVLEICEEEGCHISFICDKDFKKRKGTINDIKIISPEELINYHKDAFVIISTLNYLEEVEIFLNKYFPQSSIIPCAGKELLELIDAQYFAKDIMQLSDEEVFVDGGCFDFETSRFLMQRCNVKHIYAFEPDISNLEKVNAKIMKLGCADKVTVFEKGLWNKSENLYFSATGDIMSHVTECGNEADKIEVVALDEVIHEKVTFIKMDIEGSEIKALEGAQNLIRNYKPKLAICIYHKPEDTIDIPAYIKSLVPEYRLWIRHYSWSPAETVLYAKI